MAKGHFGAKRMLIMDPKGEPLYIRPDGILTNLRQPEPDLRMLRHGSSIKGPRRQRPFGVQVSLFAERHPILFVLLLFVVLPALAAGLAKLIGGI